MASSSASTGFLSRRHLIGLGAVAAMLLAPAGLRAQQMAATDLTGERDRHAYLVQQCGPLERADPGCVAQSTLEFSQAQLAASKRRTEEAKQRIETAQQGISLEEQLQRCGAFLREKRAGGTVFDRQVTRENICPYARELGMRDGPG